MMNKMEKFVELIEILLNFEKNKQCVGKKIDIQKKNNNQVDYLFKTFGGGGQ